MHARQNMAGYGTASNHYLRDLGCFSGSSVIIPFQLKGIHAIVLELKKMSGWHWSDETGASITDENASSWDDFVATRPDAAPFRNDGWAYLNYFDEIIPKRINARQHVFHPTGAHKSSSHRVSHSDSRASTPLPSNHRDNNQLMLSVANSPVVDNDDEDSDTDIIAGTVPVVLTPVCFCSPLIPSTYAATFPTDCLSKACTSSITHTIFTASKAQSPIDRG